MSEMASVIVAFLCGCWMADRMMFQCTYIAVRMDEPLEFITGEVNKLICWLGDDSKPVMNFIGVEQLIIYTFDSSDGADNTTVMVFSGTRSSVTDPDTPFSTTDVDDDDEVASEFLVSVTDNVERPPMDGLNQSPGCI